MTIALLLYNKGPSGKPTLIVCPVIMISQWERELLHRTKEDSRFSVLHYKSSSTATKEEVTKYDVVITTYGVLRSHMKKRRKERQCTTLIDIAWHRVVLDEAQEVRNHKTDGHQAVCAIPATNRWVLTGTPINNSEWDMYACFYFLRYKPMMGLDMFKRHLLDTGESEYQRLLGRHWNAVVLCRRTGMVSPTSRPHSL